MTDVTLSKTEVAYALLRMFPAIIRNSLCEDAEFRREYGLTLKAHIRLNNAGVTFDRGALYSAVRTVLGGEVSKDLQSIDKTDFVLLRREGSNQLVLNREGKEIPLPDFECLSPEQNVRLESFAQGAKEFRLDSEAVQRWTSILTERPCDDEEVEQLRDEFRLTPKWFIGSFRDAFLGSEIDVPTIVPADGRYYKRLVGATADQDLLPYVRSITAQHVASLVGADGASGFLHALLLSAHSEIPKNIEARNISEHEMREIFQWLETKGDQISQLGAIEFGLSKLDILPALEPMIANMIKGFVSDSTEETGRLSHLAGLIVLVEGEFARTGIFRTARPFWRRLASIAHASLLQREMAAHGIPAEPLSAWAMDNRSQLFYSQSVVDMRTEPRWLPDFLTAAQLKSEFIGRISVAATLNRDKIRSADLMSVALEPGGPVQSLLIFPYPYLPGPLEGGVESQNPMPEQIERELPETLQRDVLTPKSFAALVNSALIFKVGPELAERAAESLRRAKYQLRDMGAQGQIFTFLHGLATVAAVTRSETLAAEVRVLTRVVRRRPGSGIELEHALQIATVAAAAFSDIEKWCSFFGEWLTEFAYEEVDVGKINMLWGHIRALCRIEKRLWSGCARADAACSALSAA